MPLEDFNVPQPIVYGGSANTIASASTFIITSNSTEDCGVARFYDANPVPIGEYCAECGFGPGGKCRCELTAGYFFCANCGAVAPCKNCKSGAVVLPVVREDFHDFSIERGVLKFCSYCGVEYGEPRFQVCAVKLFDEERERVIEGQIARATLMIDILRIPPRVVVKPGPAWSNISAAINAVPGWNRRP